jgi:dipeptidyl aminopeptidase/acylaminoacyl peptidase
MPVKKIQIVLSFILISSFSLHAEKFNTGEVIIESGFGLELSDDEGYLYLSLDTDTDISRLTINGSGIGRKIRFNDIKKGENYALIKLAAGDYEWEHINIHLGAAYHIRANIKKYNHKFVIEPGVVNYPGSWRFHAEWTENFRASLELENHNILSYELEHFKRNFKDLIGPLEFKYQNEIKDPYPQFLAEAIQNRTEQKALPNMYFRLDNIESLPMTMLSEQSSIEAVNSKYPLLKGYFRYDTQYIRSVSPDQKFMLFSAVNNQVVTVGIIGVKNLETYILYQQQLPVNSTVSKLSWVDNDSFFLTLSNSGVDRSYVAHLTINEQDTTINASFIKFRYDGHLLDGLVRENNQLFFDRAYQKGSKQKNTLYKVDVTDERSIDDSFKKIYKNTKNLKNVVDWLTDEKGHVRAALSAKYDKKSEEVTLDYWFLSNENSNDWKKIKTETASDYMFWFLTLSEDESYFLVLTNEHSDKYEVHKYATSDGSHLGVVYQDPDHDIENILKDTNTNQIIGYTHYENGELTVEYLVKLDDKFDQAINSNPDLKLFQLLDLSAQNRLLMYGKSSNSKGAWFLLNTETGKADKIFNFSPSYELLPKGQYHVVHTKAEDGVELEGFLVMPEITDNQKAPLIVMPHGGPIGVRDYAHNNEMQHFLANQGFATLKVNYRGSGGYGKEFESLGMQQWGEKIEQDIYTMTQYAIEQFALDNKKVCAMGGSYGGYSALMLTYLYPETYLCAISFAGVMDLPLLFTSKSLSHNSELESKLKEIVGDPTTEIEKLVNKSPLYLLKDMKRPLLLFQGMLDNRVRVEHALRMQQLISVYGLEHEVVIFEDEGHGLSKNNTAELYLYKSLEFLKENLKLN